VTTQRTFVQQVLLRVAAASILGGLLIGLIGSDAGAADAPSRGSAASATTLPVTELPPFPRPIRIPRDVPLMKAEPPFALAGQRGSWTLCFELSRSVPPNTPLKLELYGGRNNPGHFGKPQASRPAAVGYLSAKLEDGTSLSPSEDRLPGTFVIPIPEKGLPAGSKIRVLLGDTSRGSRGIAAPNVRMLGKFFVLYCPDRDPARKKPQAGWGPDRQPLIVGACAMHILGGPIDHLRAYVPSQCRPGKSVRLLVRPEDSFSNLSHEKLESLEVYSANERLTLTLHPVEGSTCAQGSVQLSKEGVQRLRVVDRRTGKECLTNPIECRANPRDYALYWGMIHGHTEMSDGTGTLDNYFRQMRDEAAVDFAATSDHDHLGEAPDSYWRVTCQAVKRWNEPGRFVVFLGYEWAKWRRNGDGDRNVYYLQDDQPMFRSDDGHYPGPPDLFRALVGRKAIIIPHHPAGDGNHCDYKDHDVEHERLVEIHQMRGCYECSAEDGNPLIARPDRPGGRLIEKGYVRNALAMGWRVGFTAGGDDHMGTAGTDRPHGSDGRTYYAGSMCVLAKERTREAIWEALWNRRVVATSGPRVLLFVDLNGHPIGSTLKASDDPSMSRARRLTVSFSGTAPVQRIDIIRNNKAVYSSDKNAFTWDDTTSITDVVMPPAKYCPRPFCFYYIRAVQTDGQAAWASPIWIEG
jgi:hypothetical protein